MKTFEKLAKDYKKSFLLVIDNKWLYGTILFFVLCDVVTKIPALISARALLSQTLGNTIINQGLNQYGQQSVSEKMLYALHSIHPLSILGSITLAALFGFVGLVIAFLVFYKKIKLLRSTTFCKKVASYSAIFLILGILVGLAGFFLKSTTLVFFAAIVDLISFGILSVLLLTIVEAVFISLLADLLSAKPLSFASISERSIRFIKTLFIFNLLLSFVSTNFVNQFVLLPQYVSLIMPTGFGGIMQNISSSGLFSSLSWFAYYFHPVFVVVFVFAPLIMAIASDTKLFSVLKDSLTTIRNESGYYLPLIIWTLLLLSVLDALSNFISPNILLNTQPIIVGILHEAIYSLLFMGVLMVFYVTAFRKILGISEKS